MFDEITDSMFGIKKIKNNTDDNNTNLKDNNTKDLHNSKINNVVDIYNIDSIETNAPDTEFDMFGLKKNNIKKDLKNIKVNTDKNNNESSVNIKRIDKQQKTENNNKRIRIMDDPFAMTGTGLNLNNFADPFNPKQIFDANTSKKTDTKQNQTDQNNDVLPDFTQILNDYQKPVNNKPNNNITSDEGTSQNTENNSTNKNILDNPLPNFSEILNDYQKPVNNKPNNNITSDEGTSTQNTENNSTNKNILDNPLPNFNSTFENEGSIANLNFDEIFDKYNKPINNKEISKPQSIGLSFDELEKPKVQYDELEKPKVPYDALSKQTVQYEELDKPTIPFDLLGKDMIDHNIDVGSSIASIFNTKKKTKRSTSSSVSRLISDRHSNSKDEIADLERELKSMSSDDEDDIGTVDSNADISKLERRLKLLKSKNDIGIDAKLEEKVKKSFKALKNTNSKSTNTSNKKINKDGGDAIENVVESVKNIKDSVDTSIVAGKNIISMAKMYKDKIHDYNQSKMDTPTDIKEINRRIDQHKEAEEKKKQTLILIDLQKKQNEADELDLQNKKAELDSIKKFQDVQRRQNEILKDRQKADDAERCGTGIKGKFNKLFRRC